MNDPTPLERVLTLALRLPPTERLRLVEQVVASVEHDIIGSTPMKLPDAEEHWGEHLLQLLEELDLTDWTDTDTNDPVEWVKQHRTQQGSRHQSYCDGTT